MGLPIWREPDDEDTVKAKTKKSQVADTPSLDRVRSARIRRMPSVHGLRGRAQENRPLRHLNHVPRLQRSHPLSRYPSNMPRSMRDGIPSFSALLETIEPTRQTTRAPPAAPEPHPPADSAQETQSQEQESAHGRLNNRQRLLLNTNRIVANLVGTIRDVVDPTQDAAHTTWGEPLTASPQPLHIHLPAAQTSATQRDRIAARASQREDFETILRREWRQETAHPRRSPTPVDAWEIMQSTIAPDTTLPSADSSFLSATVSQSFNRGSGNAANTTDSSSATTSTDDSTQSTSVSSESRAEEHDNDSVSSVDTSDLCLDSETFIERTESLAYDMYYKEMESPEGRVRIAEQEILRGRHGNRFALRTETAAVDIGLRLIEAAVDRVEALRTDSTADSQDWLNNPDALRLTELSLRDSERRHQQLGATLTEMRPEATAETSSEAPVAHPVAAPAASSGTSTPAERSRDMADALLADLDSGDQNLSAMRRIVERLASRDDVPEEWWMSMGLNLSRTRPRRLRPAGSGDTPVRSSLDRTQSGRIARVRAREVSHEERGSRL